MSGKKYESGAQKRKTEKDEEQRQQNLLSQIPKLTGYFKPTGASNNPHSEDVELDVNNNDIGGEDTATLAGVGAEVSLGEGSSSSAPTLPLRTHLLFLMLQRMPT